MGATSPTPSTVTRIPHRHGLITPKASEAASPWHRFEHDAPNALWQMNFKGHFETAQGRCHPLTILDGPCPIQPGSFGWVTASPTARRTTCKPTARLSDFTAP